MLEVKRKESEKHGEASQLESNLVSLPWPVLAGLKQKLDRSLDKTFRGLVIAIVMHRHRNNGLLLHASSVSFSCPFGY